MRNALRSFRASIKNRGEIHLPALPIPFGDPNDVTSILGVVPEALGASLGLPGDAFGRLLAALRPPGASLDRPWAVIWLSKSRPERVQRSPQNDYGPPGRLKIDFPSILGGSWEVLGESGGVRGASWEALGRSWSGLGGHLAARRFLIDFWIDFRVVLGAQKGAKSPQTPAHILN